MAWPSGGGVSAAAAVLTEENMFFQVKKLCDVALKHKFNNFLIIKKAKPNKDVNYR